MTVITDVILPAAAFEQNSRSCMSTRPFRAVPIYYNDCATDVWQNVCMPDKHTRTLLTAEDLARAVAAGVLDLPVADLTDGTALDSDNLDLVIVGLSLAGIEVDRNGVETVGQLTKNLRP